MNAIATLNFGIDGKVRCLYTDAIPLQELGTLEIKRASTVEFNPAFQKWEVVIAGETNPRHMSSSREQCLAWERDYINERLQ